MLWRMGTTARLDEVLPERAGAEAAKRKTTLTSLSRSAAPAVAPTRVWGLNDSASLLDPMAARG
jgi:hypothetical protein